MNRKLLWRGLLILAITGAAVLLAYPPGEKINLGLDLQGGMHLVLQVHTEDALRAETDTDLARFLDILKEEGITGVNGRRTGDARFAVSAASPEVRDRVAGLHERYLGNRWELSRRGDELVLTMNQVAQNEVRSGAVTQAVQTIRNRVDQFGVAEPVISPTATGHRVVVQLPGVDDPERVRRLIKSTAFLEFRVVRFPKGGGGVGSREEILANYGGRLPEDVEIFEGDRLDEAQNVVGKLYYALEKRRTVTGRDLANARPGQGQFGQPIVEFTLKPQSAEAFGDMAGSNVGSGLAIVLGCGMPTPSAYILAAVLVGPILVELGLDKMTAHLFLLYYAVMSALTPPVAVAAYAAAPLAEANPLAIAGSACRFALAAFIVPFFFVYGPELLLMGSVFQIVVAAVTAVVGVILLAAAAEGYWRGPLRWWARLLAAAAGLCFIAPSIPAAAAGVALALAAFGGAPILRRLGFSVSDQRP